jgi:cellulose synthase/poly-beta-1,6-N-acetylglucosamine synthase-like glycosyltransferase
VTATIPRLRKTHGVLEPGPIKVLLVDADAPPRSIDAGHPDGGCYHAVRAIVLRGGRPVGEVLLPVVAGLADPDRLRALIDDTASVSPDDVLPDAALPRASVVVATTFARPESLARCVRSLAAQDYPDYEVIVVDNRPGEAATRSEWTTLRSVDRVRVLAEPRPGASAARNRGLADATGDIVAFTDDDAVADAGWLRAIGVRFASEPDADCVTGLVFPAELETPAQIWFERSGNAFGQRYVRASFGRHGRFTVANRLGVDPGRATSVYRLGEFGTGSNLAMRTGVLRELGGFDPALGPGTAAMAGEDLLLFIRLLSGGGRLAFEPGAFILHRHRHTVAELVQQSRAYGIGLTAMLLAAILDQPRHLRGLVATCVPAVGHLVRGGAAKSVDPAGCPREVTRAKRVGMLIGPFAYLRSRRKMRPWRR